MKIFILLRSIDITVVQSVDYLMSYSISNLKTKYKYLFDKFPLQCKKTMIEF